jgi:hypothetical protein
LADRRASGLGLGEARERKVRAGSEKVQVEVVSVQELEQPPYEAQKELAFGTAPRHRVDEHDDLAESDPIADALQRSRLYRFRHDHLYDIVPQVWSV